MRVELEAGIVQKLLEDKEKWAHLTGELGWARRLTLRVDEDNVGSLEQVAREYGLGRLTKQLTQWREIVADPGGRKVARLEELTEILEEYLMVKTNPKGFIFATRDDIALPYVVTKIEYHSATQHSPACVTMDGSYYDDGKVRSTSWRWDWGDRGGFAADYLDKKDIVIPSEALLQEYEEQRQRLIEVRTQVGKQFTAEGAAFTKSSWGHKMVHLGDDGGRARLVIDTDLERDEASGVKPEAESQVFGKVVVPLHPFVSCFDLRKHWSVSLHVSVLKEYVYDTMVRQHLVLPEETGQMLDILLAETRTDFKDIVAGKSGGVIILAKGPPGTGKTLTAEVCAEALERPLYVVQCSQLGLTHKEVEKNLGTVLDRASKWGALLLIDEADVYIHHRGEDLEQNAIVGVFLRTLEYYNGVLFLTTNRGTIIDDAILSRVAASLEYGRPSPDDLARIWGVLSGVSGIDIEPGLPTQYAEAHPKTSGRDVKVLLKLASMRAAHRGRSMVTLADVEAVLPFKPEVGQ